MASVIIKGQILKHLSKFAKNLSSDQIHLSTLKGEGELSNLELDEAVLTDILALPSWLKLTRASCNKVSIKIQWTKLGSQPICLTMDEVRVEIETCDTPRDISTSTSPPTPGGKYGFAERIVDGMSLTVNSIIFSFKSVAFIGTIQLSNVTILSKTPTWQDGKLPQTRIKNKLIGQVLIFKEAMWSTMRIEANALNTGDPQLDTTPLRIIANQSRVRVIVRKRLDDCWIIATRVQMTLKDLLWVLTESQLTAAVSFTDALRGIIRKSNEQSKGHRAAASGKSSTSATSASVEQTQAGTNGNEADLKKAATQGGSESDQKKARYFEKHKINETSYHIDTGRIELNVCNDVRSPVSDGQRGKMDGGAIQMEFLKLELDYYPCHRVSDARRGAWLKYDKISMLRDRWAGLLLDSFQKDPSRARRGSGSSSNSAPARCPALDTPSGHISKSTSHTAIPVNNQLNELSPNSRRTSTTSQSSDVTESVAAESAQTDFNTAQPSSDTKADQHSTGSKLNVNNLGPEFNPSEQRDFMESCVVMRLEDFAVYCVSSERTNSEIRTFIASDKKSLFLPKNLSVIHAEFTEYFLPPEEKDFQVPHSNLFITINPICLTVDYQTIIWLNAFYLNLTRNTMNEIPEGPQSSLVHLDIRLDALMPRIIIPATDVRVEVGAPLVEGLEIGISNVTLTNSRVGVEKSSRSELAAILDVFDNGGLFAADTNSGFPHESDDWLTLVDQFRCHSSPASDSFAYNLVADIIGDNYDDSTDKHLECLLNVEDALMDGVDADVWCALIEQIWLDFVPLAPPSTAIRSRKATSFVHSVPLTIWVKQRFETVSHSNLRLTDDSSEPFSYDEDASVGGVDAFSEPPRHQSCGNGMRSVSDEKQFLKTDNLNSGNVGIGQQPLQKINNTPLVTISAAPGVSGDSVPGCVKQEKDSKISPIVDSCKDKRTTAEVQLLVKADAKIKVELAHTQFCFVMKLVDTLKQCLDEIDSDIRTIKKVSADEMVASSMKLLVFASVAEAEVALIFPVVPVFLEPGGNPEDVDESVSEGVAGGSCVKDLNDMEGGVKVDSVTAADMVLQSCDLGVDAPTHRPRSPYPLSVTDNIVAGDNNQEDQSSSSRDLAVTFAVGSCSIESSRDIKTEPEKSQTDQSDAVTNVPHSLSRDTSTSANNKPADKDHIKEMTDVDQTDVIDGEQSSLFKQEGDGNEDELLNSGGSSNDSLFYQLDNPMCEPGGGLDEEEGWSGTDDPDWVDGEGRDNRSRWKELVKLRGGEEEKGSGGSPQAERKVCVLIAQLHCIEAIIQVGGKDVVALATLQDIELTELGTLPIEDFQASFTTGNKELVSVSKEGQGDSRPVRIRFELGLHAERSCEGAGESGHLQVVIDGVKTGLSSSTVTSLIELLDEEEVKSHVAKKLALNIDVTDVLITLTDDKPSMYGTPAKMTPSDFHVHRALVKRDVHGVIHIAADANSTSVRDSNVKKFEIVRHTSIPPSSIGSRESDNQSDGDATSQVLISKNSVLDHLTVVTKENNVLRRQLEKTGLVCGGLSDDVITLKKENKELVEQLGRQTEDLLAIKLERESLVAMLQRLQDDLDTSENLRNRPAAKLVTED